MVRVGIAGLGGIAGIHIAAYNRLDDVKIVAVCDSLGTEARSYPLIRDRADIKLYSDAVAMLDAEELDVLDICAPTHLHKELSLLALGRGLHVLCEKPMALTYQDAAEIAAAAKASGKLHMTAQVVRFSRPYRHLKATLKSGELGSLVSLSLYRRSTVPRWRLGALSADARKNGGCMIDLAIHDVDFLNSLLGAPDTVSGIYHPSSEEDLNDYVAATMTYGKCLVSLEGGFYTAEIPFAGGYRAIFENGSLEYDEALGVTTSCGKPLDIKDEQYPDEGVGINIPMTSDFVDEISYFIRCVKEGRPTEDALPESTAESLALAERIIASTAHI